MKKKATIVFKNLCIHISFTAFTIIIAVCNYCDSHYWHFILLSSFTNASCSVCAALCLSSLTEYLSLYVCFFLYQKNRFRPYLLSDSDRIYLTPLYQHMLNIQRSLSNRSSYESIRPRKLFTFKVRI